MEGKGDRIRALREGHAQKIGRKFTQRDAARILDVPETTYRSYEYGKSEIPEDAAKKLAIEYGVPWQAFYSAKNLKVDTSSGSTALYPIPTVQIPVVGSAPAGVWTDPLESLEMQSVPLEMYSPNRFGRFVEGDSMYPTLHPGDLAVFEKSEPKIGQIVLARSKSNELTIKRLGHDGRHFTLEPQNPAHKAAVAEGWSWEGYLVGIVRSDGSERTTRYNPHGIRTNSL